MDGDTNNRQRPPRNKTRRANKQNRGQNAENTVDAGQKTQEYRGKKQKRHPKLVPESVLQNLPVPGPHHLAALDKLLNSVSSDYGLSNENLNLRWKVFNNVREHFEQKIKGCTLRLYGSSKSGLGLKTSDVNIDMNEESEEKIPKIFIEFLKILQGCEQFTEIKEEFETKWPAINFKDVDSGLTCRVAGGNTRAFYTNSLLKVYGDLDSRVRPLCQCFRLWAKICQVDRQNAGTLPPYSFFLMTIHYLQQVKPPVLPVIHEKFGNELSKYFEEGDSGLLVLVQKTWKTENKLSLGELWLGMLRFYTNYERNELCIINIRRKKELKRSEKSWGKKFKLAIEDPFSSKRNVARTLLKANAYRYIIEHLNVALVYFSGHPSSPLTASQLKKIQSNDHHRINDVNNMKKGSASKHETCPQNSTEDPEVDHVESDEHGQQTEFDDELDAEVEDENEHKAGDGSDNEDLIDGIFAMDSINDSAISDNDGADSTITTDQSLLEEPCPPCNDDSTVARKASSDIRISCDLLGDWEGAEYTFDDSVLRKGDTLDTKCTFCGEEDHIVDNCTADQVTQTVKPLPHMPDWFKDLLTKVCYCCKDDFGITQEDVAKRQFYLRALETYIRRHMPDANLHLFGSSCNGFGFTGSDMDLCMTLEGKNKSDIDCIEYITRLAAMLRKNPECSDVIAITGAKVPIVKFVIKHAKIEADISLYNEVALWNTKLLAAYARIDPRVHILGCTLKIFVKLCDIGDASKGSLSSYAYILMLLHFLQQRRPPVLPVLQELYDAKEQPHNIVEGHNCWFFSDLKNLGTRWNGKNRESCGELWLGFLRYYTEEFDYRRNVVCVRYLKPLTKFEKLWNGRQICIEDPFVLSHNLGAALTLGMVKYIRSTFERARQRFGTARNDIPPGTQDRQRYFFDTLYLTNGRLPPTGRNCNVCGKIGHWAKECPFNNKSRQRKGQKTKDEKGQQDKQEKNQQDNAEKSQKNKKTNAEADVQRAPEKKERNDDENSSQNNNENIPINWAARVRANSIEKPPEGKQEKLKGETQEEPTEVVQSPPARETTPVKVNQPGNIQVLHNSTAYPQLPQQTILPPFLFPATQTRVPMPINSPPRTWNYQPLSPPITPGNQMPVMQPSPVRHHFPISPMPHLGMFPRNHLSYQPHGMMPGNMAPGSPPDDRSLPVKPPMLPLGGTRPSNSMTPHTRPTFSEASGGPRFVPDNRQCVVIPGAQLFGSPDNPFQLDAFQRDHMLLINSRPVYQPFESPQRVGAPFSPMNRSPRVISCEELERDDPPQSPQGDKTDGFPVVEKGGTIPLPVTEKAPNIPSVLDALRMMSVNQGENSASKTANVGEGHGSDATSAEFQQPPKVQNIATMNPKTANQDGTSVLNTKDCDGLTGEASKSRQKNKRKQEVAQAEKDSGCMEGNYLIEDIFAFHKQLSYNLDEGREIAKLSPQSKDVSPQDEKSHEPEKQNDVKYLQQDKQVPAGQKRERRKPREIKIRYKNQRPLAPAFLQKPHPQQHHQTHQQHSRQQLQQHPQQQLQQKQPQQQPLQQKEQQLQQESQKPQQPQQQSRHQEQQQQPKEQSQQQKQKQQQPQQQSRRQKQQQRQPPEQNQPQSQQQKEKQQQQQQQQQQRSQDEHQQQQKQQMRKQQVPQKHSKQQHRQNQNTPNGRHFITTSDNEKTPIQDKNQLVVNVTGDLREVIVNMSHEKSPAGDSNRNTRRKRSRQKKPPKTDETK